MATDFALDIDGDVELTADGGLALDPESDQALMQALTEHAPGQSSQYPDAGVDIWNFIDDDGGDPYLALKEQLKADGVRPGFTISITDEGAVVHGSY